jgi:hypothetical protein
MKKLIIYFLFLLPSVTWGYSWNSIGPSGITANDICFNVGSQNYTVICTSTGICISDASGSNWNSFTHSGMPVWQAIPFDSADILLVMGDSSSIDGIYKFNFVMNQFILVKQILYPTFIQFCPTNQTYYAGSVWNGLMSSSDGLNWNIVSFFASQTIASMDFFNNHMVVSKGYQYNSIYCSSDTGRTWNQGDGGYLSYIAFHPSGKLYGLIPMSISGSLRESDDFGQNWNILYWSTGIKTIGYDASGNVMVGWNNPNSTWYDQGIAKYNTSSHAMTFYNEGLPNLNVNKIRFNPLLSAIVLFCCTDSGVYFTNDYWTGINNLYDEAQVDVFPNPCSNMTNIKFSLPRYEGSVVKLFIYNCTGSIMKEETYFISNSAQSSIKVNVSDIPPGIYLYRLQAGQYSITKKLIVDGVRENRNE